MGTNAIKDDRCYTYGDYVAWPLDERWELIGDTAWNMSPAPNRLHQETLSRIAAIILPYVKDKPCKVYFAPFDVLLPEPGEDEDDTTNVVQPDISVICDASKLTEKGCTGAPDFIVEILSPYTSRKDQNEKLFLYERHGVREYWLVDPAGAYVQTYTLGENKKYSKNPQVYLGSATVHSESLKGFSVQLKEIFG